MRNASNPASRTIPAGSPVPNRCTKMGRPLLSLPQQPAEQNAASVAPPPRPQPDLPPHPLRRLPGGGGGAFAGPGAGPRWGKVWAHFWVHLKRSNKSTRGGPKSGSITSEATSPLFLKDQSDPPVWGFTHRWTQKNQILGPIFGAEVGAGFSIFVAVFCVFCARNRGGGSGSGEMWFHFWSQKWVHLRPEMWTPA